VRAVVLPAAGFEGGRRDFFFAGIAKKLDIKGDMQVIIYQP